MSASSMRSVRIAALTFFARNKECDLRCVYHGWKFDRHGDCVDMPSSRWYYSSVKVKILATDRRKGWRGLVL
jgi:phenylpropionate dioxygenase-like ring-hydroxylating dioxygenase large terminal subunit